MGKNPTEKAAKAVVDKVKLQRGEAGKQFEKPACRYCGALSRRKFEPGKGKNARLQHPRWRVCKNGHRFVYKRGQI